MSEQLTAVITAGRDITMHAAACPGASYEAVRQAAGATGRVLLSAATRGRAVEQARSSWLVSGAAGAVTFAGCCPVLADGAAR